MHPILEGEVIGGNKIGRRIGFPTANMPVGEREPLRNGVYAALVTAGGATHRAVVNVGYKPTVGVGQKRTLEAYLFDFSRDLYGQRIRVELLRFLRDERKFGSFDELRRQIDRDKREALRYFETEDRE